MQENCPSICRLYCRVTRICIFIIMKKVEQSHFFPTKLCGVFKHWIKERLDNHTAHTINHRHHPGLSIVWSVQQYVAFRHAMIWDYNTQPTWGPTCFPADSLPCFWTGSHGLRVPLRLSLDDPRSSSASARSSSASAKSSGSKAPNLCHRDEVKSRSQAHSFSLQLNLLRMPLGLGGPQIQLRIQG